MGWLSGVGIASVGDIYGPDAGASTEQTSIGSGLAPTPTTVSTLSRDGGDSAPKIQSVNLLRGLSGINPLLFIPLGLGTLVLIRLVREWGAHEGEVREARAGLYFGVMAAGWSIVLIPLAKAFAAKYHIPGLSEYIQNA